VDTSVEIVIDDKMNAKGQRMLEGMRDAARSLGIRNVVTKQYAGKCDILMIYGFGSPLKKPWFDTHIASGRIAAGWDLGYFGRQDSRSYPMRLTINAEHPQKLLWHNTDESRWARFGKPLRNDFNPNGHIVLCGMGRKSRWQYGYNGTDWETRALNNIQRSFPGARIIYRPKQGATELLKGVKVDANSPIESVIRGSRMVVVHHSNVAVDACIAGVPVVCSDGAAAALYGDDICNPTNPTIAERMRFLSALAWWQWRPEESKECWNHILSVSTSALERKGTTDGSR